MDIEDRLTAVGVVLGVFVIVAGLGTLLGLPWTTTEDTAAAAIQMVGIVVTIAIGVVLLGLTYADEPGGSLFG